MNASGRTLTVGELFGAFSGIGEGNLPIYIGHEEALPVLRVDATFERLTLTVDLPAEPEDECRTLLRRFVAKEITATQLRKLAADLDLTP